MGFFLAGARTVFSALLIAGGSAVAPAQAQFLGFWGARPFSNGPAYAPGISPGEIAGIVADEGMHLVARPYRNRNAYVVDAQDQHGWNHRLIIDAYSGQIIQSFGQGQALPPQLAPPEPPLPSRPGQRLARVPEAPYVVPGIGGEDQPVAKPKPKPARQRPVVARAPVESRPLDPPTVRPMIPAAPRTVIAPAKPLAKPPALARTPVEARPLDAQPARKIIPQVLPGYAPPTAVGAPLKQAPPAVAAPVTPLVGTKARDDEPVALAAPQKPVVKDVPVAPFVEAPAPIPAGKVNDVPVAPLD